MSNHTQDEKGDIMKREKECKEYKKSFNNCRNKRYTKKRTKSRPSLREEYSKEQSSNYELLSLLNQGLLML